MHLRVLLCILSCVVLLGGCDNPILPFSRPNIVIIFVDDLGYGDIGAYGHPTIQTPHLDRMAEEGMKFTQFYTAASVCTPSRAALLTGRLPIRNGMGSDGTVRRVLFPDSKNGLPDDEITLAEALRERNYATAAIGKWHLGHRPEHLPMNHGFDMYYGIPYSNDMDRAVGGAWKEIFWEPKIEYWDVPLIRDTTIIERPAEQTTITRRYTEEAVTFIQNTTDSPFFVYLAHSMPHTPLFTSEEFEGVSKRGLYGDVIEEIDWSVGQIMKTLEEEGLDRNTLLFFTSDNGPWLTFDTHGGSAGLLHGGKGMTWEGGMRVPGLAWWPGTVPAGVMQPIVASTMDLFPTALAMAGLSPNEDRTYDGENILPILKGESNEEVHDAYFYYRNGEIYAVRKGPWKLHLITEWEYEEDNQRFEHDPPLLFHLDHDPSEQYDVANQHPEIIEEIITTLEAHKADMIAHPTQLD